MTSEPLPPSASPEPQPEPAPSSIPPVEPEVVPRPMKTPFYKAIHASWYERQGLIRKIQDQTQRRLICYVSGEHASIRRGDTVGFVDLLHNVRVGEPLDLLLHTGGGDIDAAEKLVAMVRKRVRDSEFRVVIPDYAKSAGTLIALGADALVMSDSSELGPIDPQVFLADANGNLMRHSVQNYLDAYNTYSEALAKNPDDLAAKVMLQKLDPPTVELMKSVMERARHLAEGLLGKGMFRKTGGNSTQTARVLLNTKRWESHGQMISLEDAQDPEIGLTVQPMDAQGEIWQNVWQLYCLQRLSIKDSQKLFESDYVSLPVDDGD